MKAFIITLKNNSNALRQLDNCQRTAKQWAWDVEVFWAIDGKFLSPSDFQKENLSLNPNTKIYRRPGAQGCFMSHWELWKHCVKINQPIIILESDAHIIGKLPSIDFSEGLVKLHEDKDTKYSDVTGKWSKGAHAYALTPDHANLLISGTRATEVKPADKAIGSNFVSWRYLNTPIVTLKKLGAGTTSKVK